MFVRRIAYVLKSFPLLTQTFVVGELAELRRRGVEVQILALKKPPEEPRHDLIARAGLDQITVYGAENFVARLKQFQPQLLHAHFATDGARTARRLADQTGIPFTFTAHGYDIYFRAPADFEQRAHAAKAIVTVSEANKQHIVKILGVAPDHIQVIPNGVDTDFFRPAPHPTNTLEQPPLVVCVARHEPVKNLALLLQSCAILRDRGVAFRCVMVGGGAGRAELEKTTRELGLDGLIEMTGELARAEVLRWWQRATVAVLSSDSEGMPVSLIEAAACGVPAVATRVGGIPELVEHGVTGFLAPPRDASALANALAQMLENREHAAAMGSAARRRAEEQFSLALQVDRLLAMWEGLLDRPSSLRSARLDLPGEPLKS